jgi:predicted DNA-binding transcriptional regulator AlpA
MKSIAPTRPAPLTREQLLAKAVWTVTDVCVYFDVSDETLRRWRDADRFPAPRVMPGGRSLRWDVAEVLVWWNGLERAA